MLTLNDSVVERNSTSSIADLLKIHSTEVSLGLKAVLEDLDLMFYEDLHEVNGSTIFCNFSSSTAVQTVVVVAYINVG